ncbi:MAG: hypothetical protein MZV70_52990 [Desulfobacterales bacterium]|nr:hypothetical protein [Desulfobacterales bacterium]
MIDESAGQAVGMPKEGAAQGRRWPLGLRRGRSTALGIRRRGTTSADRPSETDGSTSGHDGHGWFYCLNARSDRPEDLVPPAPGCPAPSGRCRGRHRRRGRLEQRRLPSLSARGGSHPCAGRTVPSRVVYELAAAGPLALAWLRPSRRLMALELKTGKAGRPIRGLRPPGRRAPSGPRPMSSFSSRTPASGRQRLVFLRSR